MEQGHVSIRIVQTCIVNTLRNVSKKPTQKSPYQPSNTKAQVVESQIKNEKLDNNNNKYGVCYTITDTHVCPAAWPLLALNQQGFESDTLSAWQIDLAAVNLHVTLKPLSTNEFCPKGSIWILNKTKPCWTPWAIGTGNLRYVRSIRATSDKTVRIRKYEIRTRRVKNQINYYKKNKLFKQNFMINSINCSWQLQ